MTVEAEASAVPAPSVRGRRRLVPLALVAVALVAVPIGLVEALFLQPLPRRPVLYTPDRFGMPDYEPVRFRPDEPGADDIVLSGWYIPGARAETVVLCHGRGDTRDGLLPVARMCNALGYSALVTEFRGHGDSGGDWSTLGAAEQRDLLAALDWLAAQGPRPVAAFGYSMGGGVALSVAARDPRILGVATEGAVADLPGLVRFHYGPLAVAILRTTTPWVRLRTGSSPWDARAVAVIEQIAPRPVLIIHSRADRVVPFHHGEILYAAAGQPKGFWALDDVPHVSGVTHKRGEYLVHLRDFLTRTFGGA